MGDTALAYLEHGKEERMKKERKGLNAKAAKLAANKRAAEIEEKRVAAENKRAEEAAKKWRDDRANWLKNKLEGVEQEIAEAVDKGKTNCTEWLASSDKRENAEEEGFWERFAYKPELKKVLAHFKELGYTLKFGVKKETHVDLSDLSPGPDTYSYTTLLEISW